MKLYKHTYPDDQATPIDENTAIQELHALPTEEEDEDAFIRFEEDDTNYIQLRRLTKDRWLLDTPIMANSKIINSKQDNNLTTETVIAIIKRYFLGAPWQQHCQLQPEPERS